MTFELIIFYTACDINFEQSCYIVLTDSLSAAGARSRCQQQYGGHLAIIESQQENDAIHGGLLGKRAHSASLAPLGLQWRDIS